MAAENLRDSSDPSHLYFLGTFHSLDIAPPPPPPLDSSRPLLQEASPSNQLDYIHGRLPGASEGFPLQNGCVQILMDSDCGESGGGGGGVLGAIHSLIREELSQQKGVGWVCWGVGGGAGLRQRCIMGAEASAHGQTFFFPDCRRRAAHPRMHLGGGTRRTRRCSSRAGLRRAS